MLLVKCQESFNEFISEPLTLGYNLKGFSTTGTCDKKLSALKSIYVGFRGISFTPFGLRLKAIFQIENLGPIEAVLSLGLKEFEVLISDQKISLANAISLLKAPIRVFLEKALSMLLYLESTPNLKVVIFQ